MTPKCAWCDAPITDHENRLGSLCSEHAKRWCRAERRRIEAERQALREQVHALKVREREVVQLEDELKREGSAS
jgi:hypothetical protein